MPKMENLNSVSELFASLNKSTVHTSNNKTYFEGQPVLFTGCEVKEHYPYLRDENGKKIPSGQNRFGQTYKKAENSDGWMATFIIVGSSKALYVVFKEKPLLEPGSLYKVTGYGYGRNGIPGFLDEEIKLVRLTSVTVIDSPQVVVDEN